MRVLVFGDSITQGFWDTDGGWVSRLRKYYDERFLSGEDSEHTTVFNLGISGETSTQLLERLEGEILPRQKPKDQMCIVVAIGTNDNLFESHEQWTSPDDFKANIEKVCEVAEKFSDRVIFFGANAVDEEKTMPVSWGDFSYTNEELEKYENITQEVVENQGHHFVPLFQKFKSIPQYENLLSDGLHPNDEGHAAMAETILPELEKILKS